MPVLTPLRAQLLAERGFRHGFSPRAGGVSRPPYDACNLGRGVGDDPNHVAENRMRFAQAIGYADGGLFEVHQVHGCAVSVVRFGDDPAALRSEPGDGLIARASLPGGLNEASAAARSALAGEAGVLSAAGEAGVLSAAGEAGVLSAAGEAGRGSSSSVAVGVRAADCVPVLLADPGSRSVGALHSGWRGTVLAIARHGVERLAELEVAAPERFLAAIFPHIRVCCFEVSEEVADRLQHTSRLAGGPDVVRRPGPKPHVDLAAIVRAQLMAAGLPADQIEDVAGCTRCEPERFFSYRRDGQASGRHLAAIVAG